MDLFAFLAGAGLVLAVLVLRGRLASFAAQRPSDYGGKGPAFDLARHLGGPILCEGMIFGPAGRVGSRFVARMDGRWDGGRGVLAERFHYDTGRVQDREWRLTVAADGSIRAEADDLVGPGIGTVSGSTVCLRYRIRLAPEAGGHVLSVTDWMYLMDNGTILNRSQFRKWGLVVAELQATMRPLAEATGVDQVQEKAA
jgi:hypothetical protein